MFYAFIKIFFRPLVRVYLRLRTEGSGNVPSAGPALIAANHASFLDPIVLGSACPRPIHFIVLQTMYDWWRLRWFYWGMQTIPVRAEEGDPRAVRQALSRLRRGDLVGIFPEGGRSRDGRLRAARPGAALMAAISGVPVIPAHIGGAWEAWRPGKWFPAPCPVRVRFGEALRFEEGKRGLRDREAVEVFSRRLMEAIAELGSEGEHESAAGGGGERAAAPRPARNP
jgi:1-acyl-sn-glycerol-3-phosphate acyltransferase